MQLPNFATYPGERGNTHITFSWARCPSGRLAFPEVRPFVKELWDAIPRLNEQVILQVTVQSGKHLFEVVAPPIWCLNNAYIELAYKEPIEFVTLREYEDQFPRGAW